MRAHAVWGEGGGNFMTGAAFNMNGGGGGAAAPPKAMLDPPLIPRTVAPPWYLLELAKSSQQLSS